MAWNTTPENVVSYWKDHRVLLYWALHWYDLNSWWAATPHGHHSGGHCSQKHWWQKVLRAHSWRPAILRAPRYPGHRVSICQLAPEPPTWDRNFQDCSCVNLPDLASQGSERCKVSSASTQRLWSRLQWAMNEVFSFPPQCQRTRRLIQVPSLYKHISHNCKYSSIKAFSLKCLCEVVFNIHVPTTLTTYIFQ